MRTVKKLYECLPIILLLIVGFSFRYIGIIKNLSFWNDEIHAAIFSRGILWHGIPVSEIGTGTGLYQLPFYYVTALFFKLFGTTEFAGRLPSVIIGTFLIGIVFYISRKIIGIREAYIAAFLTAFSQMQLAWSTQLRPYIWLETFTFIIVYFCYKNINNKTHFIDKNIIVAILLSIIASLFHGTGLINIGFVIIAIILKSLINKKFIYILSLIPLVIVGIIIIYFSLSPINRNLSSLLQLKTDTLHYRVFLRANYSWLILGSMLGSLYFLIKNKLLFMMLFSSIILIFIAAIFKINSGYVRYSLPAFPLLYVLFATGIVFLFKICTFFVKNNLWKNILSNTFIVLIIILVAKNNDKINFSPSYYYTINGDMRENPVVDYKKAFSIMKNLMKGQDVIVMDAWNDRVPWYLPGQKYIYLLQYKPDDIDVQFGEKMVSTIYEFEKEKNSYKKGVVLVENWESQTAPDLQKHIRNNLKHEADINNLPYNEADKWSISVYSWGL